MSDNNPKLDLNKPFMKLDRTPDGNDPMGKSLANALAYSKEGDALKLYNWALKLNDGESLSLDESDIEMLKEFIKKAGFPNIGRAQLENEIKAQLEKE